ncbi:MAG: sulfur oxidation c-type cytochrome SoxX [Gammaproteobacteria bacterium]|nr:sulfur oxidation c-type cytochrome SoxX [Gammaproteobacteria bacterium]
MKFGLINMVASIALIFGIAFSSTILAASPEQIAEGKKVALDRKKGNCLSCHAMADGVLPGNIGPPLVAMKARFPDISVLRAQIYDATAKNPRTIMPPFGKHGILSDKEIDLVTDFIHSL